MQKLGHTASLVLLSRSKRGEEYKGLTIRVINE
jgi:hypothetical protein